MSMHASNECWRATKEKSHLAVAFSSFLAETVGLRHGAGLGR
jgi:hypothetical protein